MQFRDCFINKIDYLQWGLAQTIIDKAKARINNAELKIVDYNLNEWEYYLIKAIFAKSPPDTH